MLSYYIPIATICLALVQSYAIDARQKIYAAQFDKSIWDNNSSLVFCSLEHTIPEYGSIVFEQYAGEREQSKLKVLFARQFASHRATLEFNLPNWSYEHDSYKGWKFTFGNTNVVHFTPRQTRQILDALDHGFEPTIVHRDNTNRADEVKAIISLVNFNKAYKDYLMCQNDIVPISFKDIQNTDILFESGSTRLDNDALQILSYIMTFINDSKIRKIELNGYTDSVGSFRENHKLASERVEVVRDYLLENGVSEELFKLRVFGEQRAKAKNFTESGRKQNRRVNVKVYR